MTNVTSFARATRAAGGGRKSKTPANQKSSVKRLTPPPELLNDVAIKKWREVSKILKARGTLEPEDFPLLTTYCNTWSYLVDVDSRIWGTDYTAFAGEDGIKKHPHMGVRNDMIAQLVRLGSLLGLDPLSRLRIKLPEKKTGADKNEFGDF